MKLPSLILIAFCPIIGIAQQQPTDLWGSKKIKFGLTLQVAPSLWTQSNLDAKLREINLPESKSLSNSLAIGDVVQVNKVRFSLLLIGMISGNANQSNRLNQQFGGIELNGEYFVIKKEKIALSPSIGGGLLYGTSRFRRNMAPGSFSDAFMTGNTTTLFNRQGYLNVGLNLGFDYSSRMKEHIYQISLGYRAGFLNTKWSTEPAKETLADGPADALRQLYISIKANLFFGK